MRNRLAGVIALGLSCIMSACVGPLGGVGPAGTSVESARDALRDQGALSVPSRALTIDISGQGTVERTPDDEAYAEGIEVELTALPDTNWKFSHWEGDASGSINPVTIVLSEDTHVTAVFTPIIEYTLTIQTQGDGSVAADPDQPGYGEGIEVELTATPSSGWYFSHWEGDLSGVQNPVNLIMDGDRAVKAVFAEDEPVAFTDPNLESAVREVIGRPTGDILVTDVRGVTELDLTGKATVASLDGLEWFANLEKLLLPDHAVEDLGPLASLTSLTTLDVFDNAPLNGDIAPLAGLVNLEVLNIRRIGVTDITPLANLHNLRELHLIQNDITDITVVENFDQLEILQVNGNKNLTDISVLEQLPNLVLVHLNNTAIEDISPLVRNPDFQVSDAKPTVELYVRNMNPGLGPNGRDDVSTLEARGVRVYAGGKTYQE